MTNAELAALLREQMTLLASMQSVQGRVAICEEIQDFMLDHSTQIICALEAKAPECVHQVGRKYTFTISTPERRCLELLARNEITSSKAAEWMRAYLNEGRIEPLPDDEKRGRPIPPHRSGGGIYTGPKCPHGRAEGWCDDCVHVAGKKP